MSQYLEELATERMEVAFAETGMSVRTTNALEREGIYRAKEVLGKTPAELLEIENFGASSLLELFRCLEKLGFILDKPQ